MYFPPFWNKMYFSLKFSSVISNAYRSHENLLFFICLFPDPLPLIPPLWYPIPYTCYNPGVQSNLSSGRSSKGPTLPSHPSLLLLAKKRGLWSQNLQHFDSGADYMRRAGPVSRAGSICRGSAVKRIKNQLRFAITWKNFSSASWDPGIAMPESRLAGLKI